MQTSSQSKLIHKPETIIASKSGVPLSCPMCLGNGLTLRYAGVLDRLEFVDGSREFYQCAACGSISLAPLPRQEEVVGFYPSDYPVVANAPGAGMLGLLRKIEWHALYRPVYRYGAKRVMQKTGIREGRLLEIGCSSGYQLLAFAKEGRFDARGLDISAPAVHYATTVLDLSVSCMTVEEANYPANHFDLVVLFNVLEHLVDPVAVLAEVTRILKPGGFVAIKTHLYESLQGRTFGGNWLVVREAPRHVLVPSRKGMYALASRVGLTMTGSIGASILENSVIIALSLIPFATSRFSFSRGSIQPVRLLGHFVGLLAIPFASVERILGLSGTVIYLARKPGLAGAEVR